MCEWSVQPKKLTVGCKSITGDAHDPKPIPFLSPNCSPHYGVQLVPGLMSLKTEVCASTHRSIAIQYPTL